jgi:hypothetical protein
MSLKQGLIFKDGNLVGRLSRPEDNKRGRVATPNNTMTVCYIQEFWQISFVRNAATGEILSDIYVTHLRDEILWCELAPVISGADPVPPAAYGSYQPNNPYTWLTEQQVFEIGFVFYPPNASVNNIREYLKCFSGTSTDRYKITMYVDQPIKGNSAPLNGLAIFTDKNLVGHAFMTLTQVKSTGEIVQRTVGFYL